MSEDFSFTTLHIMDEVMFQEHHNYLSARIEQQAALGCQQQQQQPRAAGTVRRKIKETMQAWCCRMDDRQINRPQWKNP